MGSKNCTLWCTNKMISLLGDGAQMAYGQQRVWGTIGFGISALLSGFLVDWWSVGDIKSITPALVIMLMCLAVDVVCCNKLKVT